MENRPPLDTEVTQDKFQVLFNERSSLSIPEFLLPDGIHNRGNYIISLSNLTKWMAE